MRAPHAVLADRSGAAAMMMALCMIALVGSAAFGIDLGDIYMKSRQLQGVADLAAMSAVQSLDPSATSTPQATAAATAALNPWAGGITAQATTGAYVADPSVAAAQRFTAGGASPNAVQVTLRAPVHLYFAGLLLGSSTMQVSRTAMAARAQYAAFSIGSGLAGLNGGVANALLSALTGSQVQLSVMNYQALASAQVDLLRFFPALEARAGLQAMSFNQLLATSVTPSAALSALADTLNASGQGAAATVALTLATASAGQPATPLSALFSLGPYSAQDHALDTSGTSLQVQALSLVDALLQAANGGRQLQLSLDGALPGVAKLQVWLAIGQRPSQSPWLTVTDAGQVVVRTAQMRLYMLAQLAPGLLSTLTGGALVQLPVYVEAASAQATLKDIQCGATADQQSLDLSVSPSLGTLALAQVDPTTLNSFTQAASLQRATLVSLPLLATTVTAFTDISLGGGQSSWTTVNFTQADITAGRMKSVSTQDLAQATVASLLTNTSVQLNVGGVGVPVGGGTVPPQLQALLLTAAPALDGMLDTVESLAGVQLGQGDVWGDGLRCHGSALVA